MSWTRSRKEDGSFSQKANRVENLFFHPRKCQNTFELGVDRMFLVILCMADTMRSVADTVRSVADTMHNLADTMHGAADVMHVRCGG